jgi:hypothetical protein
MLMPIQSWVKAHRKFTLGAALIAVLVAGVLISLPILRAMETRQIALAATSATQLMEDAMASPAIFTAKPDDEAQRLAVTADQLARLHDGLVLARIHFAKGAWRAAVEYTEFTQRYVLKLSDVSKSLQTSRDVTARYDDAVNTFKLTNAKDRVEAANSLNAALIEARHQTEITFQDCVLVMTLTRQVRTTFDAAHLALNEVGPDPAAATSALMPRIQAALEAAQAIRKQFNPMAKSDF